MFYDVPKGDQAYFETWKRFRYDFHGVQQRSRFEQCCVKETKALYHFEIIDMLETMGVDGWKKGVRLEPRSAYKPELLYPACKKWENRLEYHPNKLALAKALKRVEEDFAVLRDNKVEQISLADATFKMAFRKDGERKFAGLPYLRKKDEVTSQTMARAKHVLRGKAPEPCLGIHRGKKRNEARLVWCYPFEVAAIEAMFQIPLMENLRRFNGVHPIVYLTGNSNQNHSRIDRARVHADKIVCLDYSAFDSCISPQLLTHAWRIMKTWFCNIDDKAWRVIECYFATSPILMPDGYVYSGREGGVPSGSCFTQIIDSIVNALAIRYIEQRLALNVSHYGVLGDDSYISVRGTSVNKLNEVNLQAVRGVLAELGIRLNIRKSEVREPNAAFHFLGVDWNVNHTVHRELTDLLHRIICPERWSSKPEVFIRGTYRYSPEYIWWLKARVQSYMIEAGKEIHALQALVNFPGMWNRQVDDNGNTYFNWKSWWQLASEGFCRMISNTTEIEQIGPGYVDRGKDYMPSNLDTSPGTQLRTVAK